MSVRGNGIQQRTTSPSGTASGCTVMVYLTLMRLASPKRWGDCGASRIIWRTFLLLTAELSSEAPSCCVLMAAHARSMRKRLGAALWKYSLRPSMTLVSSAPDFSQASICASVTSGMYFLMYATTSVRDFVKSQSRR